MQKINLNTPLNNLSFGFVGFNLLAELHRRGQPFDFIPIGQTDLSSFSKMSEELKSVIYNKGTTWTQTYSRKNPTLRQWHIRGSEVSVGTGNHLLTFHELDELTPNEVNILNNQEQVFVTNEETRQVFLNYGVTIPVHNIPLGFDSTHFYPTNKKYLRGNSDITTWIISGKLEIRKGHHKVIPLWLKLFGNNPKHRLHLHTHNIHLKPEENHAALANLMGNKKYFNVSVYPYLENLTQLNESFNCADIVIDGGGNEGWSFPSFHCLGLGKYMVGVNSMGVREWASIGGATLVEPDGKMPCYDGKFFVQGTGWNQGNFYTYEDSKIEEAMIQTLKTKNQNRVNEKGLNIPNEFTWRETVDKILEKIL